MRIDLAGSAIGIAAQIALLALTTSVAHASQSQCSAIFTPARAPVQSLVNRSTAFAMLSRFFGQRTDTRPLASASERQFFVRDAEVEAVKYTDGQVEREGGTTFKVPDEVLKVELLPDYVFATGDIDAGAGGVVRGDGFRFVFGFKTGNRLVLDFGSRNFINEQRPPHAEWTEILVAKAQAKIESSLQEKAIPIEPLDREILRSYFSRYSIRQVSDRTLEIEAQYSATEASSEGSVVVQFHRDAAGQVRSIVIRQSPTPRSSRSYYVRTTRFAVEPRMVSEPALAR